MRGRNTICGAVPRVFDVSKANNEPQTEPINQTPIPSMLTHSALAMMEFFGTDIIEIEADVSVDNWNRSEASRDYGVTRKRLEREKVVLDFHEIRDADGNAENPLTSTARNEIEGELHRHISSQSQVDGNPDMSVSKLEVLVNSPELREATPATTDEFELTFISDPAGDAREATAVRNPPRFYEEYGFEYRNLNLRSVVETAAEYGGQGDGKVMGWNGPRDVRPRCTEAVAQAVYGLLPDEYAAMKWYTVAEDDTLELQGFSTTGGDGA